MACEYFGMYCCVPQNTTFCVCSEECKKETEDWNDAMGWWGNKDETTFNLIRETAKLNIVDGGAKIIGSTSINLAVKNLYLDFKKSGKPLFTFLYETAKNKGK